MMLPNFKINTLLPFARFSVSKSTEFNVPIKPFYSPLRLKGFQYSDIYTGNSYKIKAILNQMFVQNQESGFFLAYERMLEAIASQDVGFLQSIMYPKLGQKIEASLSDEYKIVKSKKMCQDIVFTEMNIHVGDYHPDRKRNCVQLELFNVINFNIWQNGKEKVIIDSATLSLECFILSPYQLIWNSSYVSEETESVYHRVIFETKMVEELKQRIDIFDIMSMSKKKRSKYLQYFFLGKDYEWKIKELDQ